MAETGQSSARLSDWRGVARAQMETRLASVGGSISLAHFLHGAGTGNLARFGVDVGFLAEDDARARGALTGYPATFPDSVAEMRRIRSILEAEGGFGSPDAEVVISGLIRGLEASQDLPAKTLAAGVAAFEKALVANRAVNSGQVLRDGTVAIDGMLRHLETLRPSLRDEMMPQEDRLFIERFKVLEAERPDPDADWATIRRSPGEIAMLRGEHPAKTITAMTYFGRIGADGPEARVVRIEDRRRVAESAENARPEDVIGGLADKAKADFDGMVPTSRVRQGRIALLAINKASGQAGGLAPGEVSRTIGLLAETLQKADMLTRSEDYLLPTVLGVQSRSVMLAEASRQRDAGTNQAIA